MQIKNDKHEQNSGKRSSDTSKRLAKNDDSPSGIGLWLGLLIFGFLILAPLFSLTDLSLLSELHSKQIASSVAWQHFNAYFGITKAMLTLISIVAGFRLWKMHSPASVKFAIDALWLIGPLGNLIVRISAHFTIGDNADGMDKIISPPIFSIIVAGIWTAYLMRSVRVRNTYKQKELSSKSLIQIEPIPTLNSIHGQDESVLVEFINANSKTIGTISNLGSFMDSVRITNDIGIKVINKFLIVERVEHQEESADQKYKPESGTKKKDIFQYPYNLPDEFPGEPTENVDSVILSTVKTHPCSPEMSCGKCGGSGKCTACEARGYNRCSSCGGSGKEEVRDGKYANGKPKYKKISCSRCHGSKRITCSGCNGTKKCNRCEGSGEVTCDRCDGTAFYQTFYTISTSYKTLASNLSFTDIEDIGHVLNSTKNKVAFDDDLVEWEDSNTILFDKRKDAIKVNKCFAELANNLDSEAGLTERQKLGRVHTAFENVPITIINYIFENKEYTIYIVGENNIVCFRDIPTKHVYEAGTFTRLINYFTKKKRQLAFLYIASYMFYSDGNIDEQERKLIDLLLNHANLSQADLQKFMEKSGRELSFDEIVPYLKCIRNDPRAVVFAWQCVLRDKKIEPSEVTAFNVLASYLKVDANNLEKLKLKAEKFGKLKETQLLTEYFN